MNKIKNILLIALVWFLAGVLSVFMWGLDGFLLVGNILMAYCIFILLQRRKNKNE